MECMTSTEPGSDSTKEERWGRHEDVGDGMQGGYKDTIENEDEGDEEHFVIDNSRQEDDDGSQDDMSWEHDSPRSHT